MLLRSAYFLFLCHEMRYADSLVYNQRNVPFGLYIAPKPAISKHWQRINVVDSQACNYVFYIYFFTGTINGLDMLRERAPFPNTQAVVFAQPLETLLFPQHRSFRREDLFDQY